MPSSSSLHESTEIATWIRQEFPALKVKLYNRETPEQEKSRDFAALTAVLDDVDARVHTNAVTRLQLRARTL